MTKLGVGSIGILLLGSLIGFLINQASDIELDTMHSANNSTASNFFGDIDWKATLQKIDAYYVEPQKTKTLTEAEKLALKKEAEKPKPKPLTVDDARFVGVVIGSKPAALLLLPKSNDTTRLSIGESWLADWELKQIKSDYIVWTNTQSGDEKIQKLFK